MTILVAALVYVLAHFLLYAFWLRKLDAFRKEKGIFRLHFFSAVALALAAIALVMSGAVETDWPIVIAGLSVHGIYSVSFLEVWSLSQGGYSLSILERAAEAPSLCDRESMTFLTTIGDEKRASRLEALRSLRLIEDGLQGIVLTPAGRVCCFAFRAVAWAANLRSLG
jgi:hypothetical protein